MYAYLKRNIVMLRHPDTGKVLFCQMLAAPLMEVIQLM